MSQLNKNNLIFEPFKDGFIKYKEELEKINNIKDTDFLYLFEIIKTINQKKINL